MPEETSWRRDLRIRKAAEGDLEAVDSIRKDMGDGIPELGLTADDLTVALVRGAVRKRIRDEAPPAPMSVEKLAKRAGVRPTLGLWFPWHESGKTHPRLRRPWR